MREVTDSLLIQLAGDAAFNRGALYFEEGRVGELDIKANTITALVEGSYSYRVTLRHTIKIFEGSCDCPASDGIDFCKHCVATALAYMETLTLSDSLKKSNSKDRLPAYLMTLQKEELVDKLLTQLKSDRATLNQLKIKAEIAAGKLSGKSLKKHLTAAIPYNKHLFQYKDVRLYFRKIEMALEALIEPIMSLPSSSALPLIDYAYDRISRTLETVDDSGGFRYQTLELLGDLHRGALGKGDIELQQIADYLHTIFNKPNYDFYPIVPDDYEEILGLEGRKIFIDLIRKDWDELPQLVTRDWSTEFYYRHLMAPLLYEAQTSDDKETILALYSKVANDIMDYIDLCKLCLEFELPEKAQNWYNRAKKERVKGSRQEEMLQDAQIALWLYHKDYESAGNLLWQRFAKWPSVQNYQEIVSITGYKDSKKNRQKAIELAAVAIDQAKNSYTQSSILNSLVEIHLFFNQAEEALTLGETNELDPKLLVEIAVANSTQPTRAIPLIFRIVDSAMRFTSNKSYREAIEALQVARQIAGIKHQSLIQNKIDKLLLENKRRPNFCRWTREAFADLL